MTRQNKTHEMDATPLFAVRAILQHKSTPKKFVSKFNGEEHTTATANIRALDPIDDTPTQNFLHVCFLDNDADTIAKAEAGSTVTLSLTFKMSTSSHGFVNQYINGHNVQILTGNQGV